MSSRYLKDLEIRRSKIIHIYRNGDPYTRATFVILRLPEQMALDRIIKAIEEKVKLPLNRPIRKLFELTGTIVQSHTQIEDGKYYIAASAENFFAIEYGHPANWVLVGPVRTNKYANVQYVTRAEEEGKPNKLSASNNVLSSIKTNQSNVSSKKSTGKKSSQTLKKSEGTKLFKNKNMFASEHVDNILSDQMHNETKTEDIQKKDVESKDVDNVQVSQNEKEDANKINETFSSNNLQDPDEDISKDKIEEPEKNSLDDKIQTSKEISSAIDNREPTQDENISDFQDGTTINISNEVFDSKDLNDNENILHETDKAFREYTSSKDVEDSHETHQDNTKEIGDETERDVNESFPQDLSEDYQPKNDDISDETYADAATKIQATFRGYRVRNELEKTRTSDFPEDSIDENPDLSEATNNVEENI